MIKNKKLIYGITTIITIGFFIIPISKINAQRINPKNNVIIANIERSSDTLSAYNIANKYKYDVVLVRSNQRLPQEIKRKYNQTAIIIGGNKTVKDPLLKDIKNHFNNIIRISGKDRYETNKKTIKFIQTYDNIINIFL